MIIIYVISKLGLLARNCSKSVGKKVLLTGTGTAPDTFHMVLSLNLLLSSFINGNCDDFL
jgi:hypothetical protein